MFSKINTSEVITDCSFECSQATKSHNQADDTSQIYTARRCGMAMLLANGCELDEISLVETNLEDDLKGCLSRVILGECSTFVLNWGQYSNAPKGLMTLQEAYKKTESK